MSQGRRAHKHNALMCARFRLKVCKGLKLEGRGLFHGLVKSKTFMEKEVYQKFDTCYM